MALWEMQETNMFMKEVYIKKRKLALESRIS